MQQKHKKSAMIFNLLQVPLDCVLMLLSATIAYLIRASSDKPLANSIDGFDYILFMVLVLPIWVLIFYKSGLYTTPPRGRIHQLSRITNATFQGSVAVIIVDFLTSQSYIPSKLVIVYAFLISTFLIILGRISLNAIRLIFLSKGYGVKRILAIYSDKSKELYLELKIGVEEVDLSKKVVKSVNVDNLKTESLLTKIKTLTRDDKIDIILQVDEDLPAAVQTKLVELASAGRAEYWYIPATTNLYRARYRQSRVKGNVINEIRPTAFTLSGLLVKRVIDVFAAFLALSLGVGVIVIQAVVITLNDNGPVFFKDKRLGRDKKIITVYKMRTMKLEYCVGPGYPNTTAKQALLKIDKGLVADYEKNNKLIDDPRIIKGMNVFRKLGLDEWPQFLNVLKGDLSLVGPRPHFDHELSEFDRQLPRVLAVKPGLTGLWQVGGRNDIDYEQRIRLDAFYSENWSLRLDIKIILQTILRIIKGGDGL